MIAVDNTFLSLLLHPKARPPLDPNTNKPIERLEDRIENLIEEWELSNERILIPTPVLSEFLILAAKEGPRYLAEINSKHIFHVADFDTRAAIELAAMDLEVRRGRSGRAARRGDAEGTWAKIRFDRQIVAIAKVNEVSTIYSDDKGVEQFAKHHLISVVKTWELALPVAKQMALLRMTDKPKAKRAIADESEDV